MSKKIVMGLFILGMTNGLLHAALLSPSGQPYREIVVSAQAPASVRLAAAELRDFAAKLCKANLKVVENPTTSPAIYVGTSKELTKRNITAENLPSEGYLIKTVGGDLVILGRDYTGPPLLGWRNPWRAVEAYNPKLKLCAFGEAGTLTGVYEFLRKVGGIRFYWPGTDGTVIKPANDLRLSSLQLTGSPRAGYRYPWFSMFQRSPESTLWARRIGFGGKAPVMIIHSYDLFQKYKKTHPEYFALVDGKRAFGSECVADGHGHLCLTNPAVIRQWANDIIAYFERHPEIDVFPLAPNDGLTRICECPKCQAELRPAAGSRGVFSYHIWNFTGKVAALVAKRFPNKYVGCLAYGKYFKPPEEIKRLPNTAVMICNWRSHMENPEEAAKLHADIEAWSEKVDRVYLWNWYLDHWLPWRGLPVIFPSAIAKELRYLFKNPKYCGEFIESEGQNGKFNQLETPGMQHINLYVTARLFWEPNLNINQLLQEYCRLFYGPAEKPMLKFWQTADNKRNTAIKKNPKCTPEMIFTQELLTELDGYLNAAIKATQENSIYRKRINVIRKEFANGSQRLIRLVNIGTQQLDLHHVNSIQDLSKQKPVKFAAKNGAAYSPATWLYAGYDRKYLYLKFICFEPNMKKIKASAAQNDSQNAWKDDCLEIFLCPDQTNRKKCFQLVINAAGIFDDGKVISAAGRNFNWQSKCNVKIHKSPNRWIGLVRIPFKSIGINDPNFTGEMAANFYRNRNAGQEKSTVSCWSPTGAFAHYTPEKFGILKLKK